jgi:Holliday junction resolvase
MQERGAVEINSKNVGRIAERIAMNELEARGFHIIDLAYMSKTSANVDFIASKGGASFNIQVKGATNVFKSPGDRWWVQYGYCDEAAISASRDIFNSKSEFALSADVIALLAIKSPREYRAFILPVEKAEKAAQFNLDGYYRQPKASGEARKPGKIWTNLEPAAKPRKSNPYKEREQALLKEYEDAWDRLADWRLHGR